MNTKIRKFTILSLLLVLVLIMTCTAFADNSINDDEAVNILPNPSFETWEDKEGGFHYEGKTLNTPQGWTFTLGGQRGVKVLSDEVHAPSTDVYRSGGHSIQKTIIDSSMNKGFFTYVYDKPVEEGIYNISVWVKTEDLESSEGGYIRVFPKDTDDNTVGSSQTPIYIKSGTADWTKYTGKITIPEGAAAVDLGLSLFNTEGTIWWDDIKMSYVSELPEPTGKEDKYTDVKTETAVFTLPDAKKILTTPPPGENIINLGEKGLEEGELINPYLIEHVQDNNQVRIPEGTYLLESGLSFSAKNASIIGMGEVILDRGDGHNARIILHTAGDFAVWNITLKGKGGALHGGGINPSATHPDATIILRNIKNNDGAEIGTSSGMFVGRNHAGTLYLVNMEIAGFPDNGVYGSAPALGGGGVVHVIGGLYQNNNVTNVRIGSDNSSLQYVVNIQDEIAPYDSRTKSVIQRGYWPQQPGQDIVIYNCDFINKRNAAAVLLAAAGGTTSGNIHDIRIYNDSHREAIRIPPGAEWNAHKVHITGNGNLSIGPGEMIEKIIIRGEEAESPRTEPYNIEEIFAVPSTMEFLEALDEE